jgi:Uncharacterised methyltransferase family (DUF6094)
MALMFSRLANNFAKNGYYPTDGDTIERTLGALDGGTTSVAVLDPCCGEGTALAEVKHHLTLAGASVQAFGVEYDATRAWHAKTLLDAVAHSDVHDMTVKVRSFGLLFLNPPYGDLVSDKAELSASTGGRKRLEKVFFQRCHPWLAIDGVLALIIPHYVLDAEFSTMIAKSYQDVRIHMAPEQQFKQCVILGTKRRSDRLDTKLAEQLEAVGRGELPEELPATWPHEKYVVPECKETPTFVAARINAQELDLELKQWHQDTLWPQFNHHFSATLRKHRPPLRALSDWHLALALAAGQVSGIVTSKVGRVLLIKGDTHKARSLRVTMEETGKKGEMREVRTFTDRFVPTIRAIDFSPGAMYGNLVTIQ